MLRVDPEAALELLDTRDWYEARRPGLGARFQESAYRTLDAIVAAPHGFPPHPFARTPGVRRAIFVGRFPFAFAYLMADEVYVLACEHLKRRPIYWAARVKGFDPR